MNNRDALCTKLKQQLPDLDIRRDEPMSSHTTFRVGGPAKLMALPKTEDELVTAVRLARACGVEPMLIGNGSNVLVDDGGLDRFVIQTFPGLAWCQADGDRISAGSGILLAALATEAARNALTGLEFAHGIPGTLGGAVTMNAGAYDGEMRQVVESVRVLDRDGAITTFSQEKCRFSYRNSAFHDGKYIILSATMKLTKGEPESIRSRMTELMARRREKQHLEYPSAGSTFKRPEGHFAAALIDQCGLKGLRVGGAQVSEKHAGFIVNTGSATCQDILELMTLVQERVYRDTGVKLEPEVKYLR
jgi:UDP-N-acetylmuramate dehydrogenase